jgi:hypothetical protein
MTRRELWGKIRIKLQNSFLEASPGQDSFICKNGLMRRRTLFSAVTGQDDIVKQERWRGA